MYEYLTPIPDILLKNIYHYWKNSYSAQPYTDRSITSENETKTNHFCMQPLDLPVISLSHVAIDLFWIKHVFSCLDLNQWFRKTTTHLTYIYAIIHVHTKRLGTRILQILLCVMSLTSFIHYHWIFFKSTIHMIMYAIHAIGLPTNPWINNGVTISVCFLLNFTVIPRSINMLSHLVTPIAYRSLSTLAQAIFPYMGEVKCI